MSTLEDKIAALEAELAQYAALPLVERVQWREVITAKENRLTELLRAQNAAASSAECKHLLPSLWPLFILCAIIVTLCAEYRNRYGASIGYFS
jgi:hypothetical protein